MMQAHKTVVEMLKAATDYLAGKGVEQSRLACELLASRLLNCKRLELYLKFNTVLSEKKLEAMRRGVRRVAGGEPIQYVLGQADFMGRTFKVDKHALIPRPETELLVEQVLQCDALWQKDKPVVADIGTGCGCVVISLALEKPSALYVGLDVSSEALELAHENASAFGLEEKIALAHAELSDFAEPESIDAIIANLPYVSTGEYEKLPVHIREHEPRVALDGGPDGLSLIEPAVQDAVIALKPGGFLFLEIGEKQGETVKTLLNNSGFCGVAIRKDFAEKDRVVWCLRPGE